MRMLELSCQPWCKRGARMEARMRRQSGLKKENNEQMTFVQLGICTREEDQYLRSIKPEACCGQC